MPLFAGTGKRAPPWSILVNRAFSSSVPLTTEETPSDDWSKPCSEKLFEVDPAGMTRMAVRGPSMLKWMSANRQNVLGGHLPVPLPWMTYGSVMSFSSCGQDWAVTDLECRYRPWHVTSTFHDHMSVYRKSDT